MPLAGLGSIVFGIAYVIAATGNDPRLSRIAIDAVTGGLDFAIQTGLLARGRRCLAAVAKEQVR